MKNLNPIHQSDTEKQAHATEKTTEAVNSVNETLQDKATSSDIAEVVSAINSIPKVEFPEPVTEMAVSLKGVSVVSIKGDKGDKPTKTEILEIIKPLIPKPIPGKDADNEKILEELTKRIPEPIPGKPGDKGKKGDPGKDGYSPIKGVDYFDGTPGKNGEDKEPETGESIIEKLNPLKNALDFQILRNIPDFALTRDVSYGNGGGGGGPAITFQDEGVTITQNPILKLNVVGSGGSIAYSGSGLATLTINSSAGGGHVIEDEGVPLTQRTNLNFVGVGVAVTDDAGNDATVVTINGGGGSGTVESVTGLNTNNTDPTNPIVQIAVDGVTITGAGTLISPLVATAPSTFTQTFTNQTTINVSHNFGAYPVIQVINNLGAVVIPVSITNNTVNDFTVVFSSSTTGTIIATVGGGSGGGGGGMAIGNIVSGSSPNSVLFTDASGDLSIDAGLLWDGAEFTIDGKLTVTGAIDPTMLILDEQASDPTEAANKGTIYTKDVSGATQLFYQDSAGEVQQMTTGIPFTEGSIPFADANGALTDDNDNFVWDDANTQLAIGSRSLNYEYPEFGVTLGGEFGDIGVPDFLSFNVQNTSQYGSSDFVVANDLDDGTVLSGVYGDFGIAGSNYITTGDEFTQSGDTYLYSSHSANNLNLSALGIGKRIRFATAGDSVDEIRADIADNRFTIYANKDVETTPALTDANWTQAGGWGFGTSPDRLILSSNAGPNTIQPTVSLAPTIGVTYRIVITASATSSNITYTFGGETGTAITATTITDFITASTTDNLIIIGAASATAVITAVSVRELIADTGDLFIEGNLKFGGNIQNTSGANVLDADASGVATFAEIPFGPASDPTSDNQLARKAYVDALAQGIFLKTACRVATTTAGTLASSFENGDTIDGVVLATNDRILIKNQVSQKDNGIYTVNASGAPTRATDSDTSAEVKSGTFTFITAGTVNAGSQWMQTAVNPTLDTDALTYSLFTQASVYTASNGVQLVGSNFSAKLSATGAVTLTGAGSDELTVATDDSSIEKATNAIRVKALGITNAMLAGSITNAKLSNSSLTVGSTAISLGASSTTLAGLTSVTSTTFVGALTGNSSTATTLATPRTIGGVSFNGSANITVATATGGFTVSGGDLALGANNLTLTGSIGATGARTTKLWATNIESTNAPTVSGAAVYYSGGTDVALIDGGTGASLSDPGANGLLAWDDTDNTVGFWTLGSGLNYDHATHSISSSGAGGASTALDNLASVAINTALVLGTSDGAALGSATKMWSDIFLASGAVVNFNNGNATLTHSAALLTSNVNIAVPDDAFASTWDGSVNVPTKNAVYDQSSLDVKVNYLKTIQALGSSAKFLAVGTGPYATTQAPTDGQAKFIAVYVDRATTLTGVKFLQITQGVYTADNNNYIALYSYSGGTLTQVAISTNNGNLWKGSGDSVQTVPFVSTYAAAVGVYFIGYIYNNSAQTTAPVIGCSSNGAGSVVGSSLDLTNSAKLLSVLNSQTALPSSQAMSGLSVSSGVFPWFALY